MLSQYSLKKAEEIPGNLSKFPVLTAENSCLDMAALLPG
jgi:hypothetical protein